MSARADRRSGYRLELSFMDSAGPDGGHLIIYPRVFNVRKAQALLLVEEMDGTQHRHKLATISDIRLTVLTQGIGQGGGL